jgi:3-oxoacid CoA-transferase
MDLCSNPDGTKIVVLTDHTDKNGKSKILEQCSLPLTGAKVVSRIITELVSAPAIPEALLTFKQAVFDVDRVKGGLTLLEHAPGVSVDEIKQKTGAKFIVSDNLKPME